MSLTLEKLQQFLNAHIQENYSTTNLQVLSLTTSSKIVTTKDFHDLSISFENHTPITEYLFTEYVNEIKRYATSSNGLQFSNFPDFQLFNQFFGILLEFARYEITSLRLLYSLSHIFSLRLTRGGSNGASSTFSKDTSDGNDMITTKYSIRNHPVWNNLPFWIDITKAMVNEDLDRYDFIVSRLAQLSTLPRPTTTTITSTSDSTATTNNTAGILDDDDYHEMTYFQSHFYHLTKEHVLFFTIMTRIDAIITSMKSLLLSKDLIENYQSTILTKLHLKDFFPIIDLTEVSLHYWHTLKSMILLTIIKRLQLSSNSSSSSSSNTPSQSSSQSQGNTKHPNSLHHPMNTPFYFHTTIWNDFCDKYETKGLQAWKFTAEKHYHKIGFSSLLQLFYLPALMTIYSKDSIYLNKFAYLRKNPQNLLKNLGICFCGHEQYYSAWNLIGKVLPKIPTRGGGNEGENNEDHGTSSHHHQQGMMIIDENIRSIVLKMKKLTRNYEETAVIEEKHIQLLEDDDLFTHHVPSIICEYCYRQLFFQYPNSSIAPNPLNLAITFKNTPNHEPSSAHQNYDIITIGSASIAFPVDDIPLKRMIFIPDHLRSSLTKGKLEEFHKFMYDFYGKKPTLVKKKSQNLNTVIDMISTTTIHASASSSTLTTISSTSAAITKSEFKESDLMGLTSSASHYSNRQLPAVPINKMKSTSGDSYENNRKDSIDSNASDQTGKISEASTIQNAPLRITTATIPAAVSMKSPTSTTLTPNASFSMQGNEFQNFLTQLWNGITVTLIYSNHPLVAKTRIIFIRSNSTLNDDLFRKKINMGGTSVASAAALGSSSSSRVGGGGGAVSHLQIIEWLRNRSVPLYLGWAHLKERDALKYDIKKSISLYDVKEMKIGSKQYKNCMKIITDVQIIMMKIENDTYFDFVQKGLTELFSNASTSFSK